MLSSSRLRFKGKEGAVSVLRGTLLCVRGGDGVRSVG